MSYEPAGGDKGRPVDEFGVPVTPKPPGRGCLFYGCLSLAIGGVLALVLVGAAGLFLLRTARNLTSPAPLAFEPVAELPAAEAKDLQGRVEAFQEAADRGEGAELTLTEAELNALIDREPDLRDRVRLAVADDRLRARVSIPLDEFKMPGRYLNAEGALRVRFRDGRLDLAIEDLTVRGRPVPGWIRSNLDLDKALAEEAADNPDLARALRRLDDLRVGDGRVVVRVRPDAGAAADDHAEAADHGHGP